MHKCPDDAQAAKAWGEIMKIARSHALIVQAYGGVATLATPEAQREAGIRDKTLRMSNFEPEPEAHEYQQDIFGGPQ